MDNRRGYRYLLYCSHAYAFPILRPLQKVIVARGDQAAWFFDRPMGEAKYLSAHEHLIKEIEGVKRYRPDAVFVPGNVVPDFFPGLKVQLFHGLANDFTGKKGHFRIRGFFDLYCTRGKQETAIFARLAKKHQHFEVVETGWPKLDPLFSENHREAPDPRHAIAKPIVLYASTFSPSLTSAPILPKTIETLSKKGRWHWFVMLHPKMPAQVVSAYRALEGPNLSFFDNSQDVIAILKAADVMLCDTSSIALEFMMLDKPVVTFRAKIPGPHLLNVQTPGEIEPALEKAFTRPAKLMENIRTHMDGLHSRRNGRSSENVLAATDALIQKGVTHLRPKPLNLWRKWQIRKRLGYYHFR